METPPQVSPGETFTVGVLGSATVVGIESDWEQITVDGETLWCATLAMVSDGGSPFGWFLDETDLADRRAA